LKLPKKPHLTEIDITGLLLKILQENEIGATPVKVIRLKQILTHRIIHADFHKISLNCTFGEIKQPYCLVDSQKVSNFAFPKIITSLPGKQFR
jgi:hypothetical protein